MFFMRYLNGKSPKDTSDASLNLQHIIEKSINRKEAFGK